MRSAFRQRGVVIMLPLILLLTGVAIFSHTNAQRTLRLQQHQTTVRAVNLAYAQAHGDVQRLLATLRVTPVAQLTTQLPLPGLSVSADEQVLPTGAPLVTYHIEFQQPVQTLVHTLNIHFEAAKYSALQQLPSAMFVSTTPLPVTMTLSLWHDDALAPVRAQRNAGAPIGNTLHCRQSRLPQCSPISLNTPVPSRDAIFDRLFNRSAEHLSSNSFIAAIHAGDCQQLPATPDQVIWVAGNCQLAVKQTLGHANHPVLLIIENGDLRLAKDATITGLVLLMRRGSALASDVIMAAGASVTGAMVNTAPLTNTSRLTVIADEDVLTKLQRSEALAKITMVPGSWRDFE